jgi:hypothetical protein
MGRNTGAVNYALGSLIGNTFNIYLHGVAVLSGLTFLFGLITSGNIGEAITVVMDFYISKLLPWPLDEIYLAQTLNDLIISHVITVGVGVSSATFRWWTSQG